MPTQTRHQILRGLDEDNSTLSELSSAQFAESERESSALDDTLPPTQKRRGIACKSTWSWAREAVTGEAEKDKHGRKIWYCKRCGSATATLERARRHLKSKHGVTIVEEETSIKAATKQTIEDIFGKQKAQQEGRSVEQEKHLTSAVNKEAFEKSIAQLITINNLPHSIIRWPAFQAVLHSINYMASDVLQYSRHTVPKLIQ
ncbi:hypothetical protein B0A49_08191 [Cryomyces minteri]|uniref:BED-type domain-containing protein n=1 Tax=Cryomyces minteri TaxID=331657 RepID=A0A4V5NHL8_9PEZI|nr:hypothetical protein B0A49_08191 [Cryomyces minteri]